MYQINLGNKILCLLAKYAGRLLDNRRKHILDMFNWKFGEYCLLVWYFHVCNIAYFNLKKCDILNTVFYYNFVILLNKTESNLY